MNLANPPSNPALLDYLARRVHRARLRHEVAAPRDLTSLAYQRSWRPNETNRLDERNFSRAARPPPAGRGPARRRRPGHGRPRGPRPSSPSRPRAVLRARSTASTIGRSRDYADRVFGRSTARPNCDCSRSDEPNLLQLIYLQNDQDVHTPSAAATAGSPTSPPTAGDGRTGEDLAQLDQPDRARRSASCGRSKARGAKAGDAGRQSMAARLADLRKRKEAALRAAERRDAAEPNARPRTS